MLSMLAAAGLKELLASPWLLLPICLGIFYVVYQRPQNKKQRELENWIQNVGRGEEIITTGGLYGKIYESEKNSPYVILELQDKVRVRMLRSYIAGKPPEVKQAKEEKKEKEK